jgi:hypothetical protein
VAELTRRVTERVSLDLQPFSFSFKTSEPGAEERVARIYRLARVTSHDASHGRVVITGEVPRRLLTRIGPASG